ncbi:hypothetical protein LTR24_005970 [Lithohypha guttulata]|uniref:Zn(2)-C6 fungal-type domain-containing protein n=1 Tax=Lithohypha guttulata TaxID=1690604 RepID=A0ABR0K7S2_9EURO|nr:hypothetical protein LTR24_005970 [Lithohypha guttulata]
MPIDDPSKRDTLSQTRYLDKKIDKLQPNDPRVAHKTAVLNGYTYGYLHALPASTKRGTIVLIHGFPDLSFGWRYQIPYLSSLGFEVIAPDCLGYGRSDSPPTSKITAYTYRRIADDIEALCSQLGVSSIILGGHDWGGAIVYRVSQFKRHLVKAVFAICTPYEMPRTQYTPLRQLVAKQIPNFAYQLHFVSGEIEEHVQSEREIRAFLNSLYGARAVNADGSRGESAFDANGRVNLDLLPRMGKSKLLSDEEMDYYVKEYARHGINGPLNWYRSREAMFLDDLDFFFDGPKTEGQKYKDKVIGIEQPCLYIFATRDMALQDWMSRQMAARIPRLTRRDVEASHWALWEKPGEVNRHIGEWLEKVSGEKIESDSCLLCDGDTAIKIIDYETEVINLLWSAREHRDLVSYSSSDDITRTSEMTETVSPANDPPAKAAKAYSCIRCFDRKVKCNRESPCSNCSKSGVECVFRVPPAPRRRNKRIKEDILKARISQYEEILKSKGIDIHKDGIKPEDLPEPTAPSHRTPTGEGSLMDVTRTEGSTMPQRAFVDSPKLIFDQGRMHFVENQLWTSMAEAFPRSSETVAESSDEDDADTILDDGIDYVLDTTPSSASVRDLHPLPEQVSTLWHIFLENVNPLSKVIHVPSLEPAITETSAHLDKLPRNLEALLFAIYSLAVLSLQPDECQAMLGESKTVLVGRYTTGTKRALSRAKFLGTSDLMVLQAFVLHLLCMRDMYDSKTMWTLSGVASRIAEGMGCHRDGTSLGLGPFETELRRRIWWQLIYLDFRSAELTGLGNSGNIGLWDCRVPSNINDADIWSGIQEAPEPQERGTEMTFCLTRYELGQYWKRKLLTKEPSGNFSSMWSNYRQNASIEEKEKSIEDLEQTLEHKFVRFCDPSIPVEFLAILVTRAATNGMRFMAHHPRRYTKDEDVPDSERKVLWSLASKLLEIQVLPHASKPMNRFRWHTDYHFQWQALIYIITELKREPLQEQADRGWQLLSEVFEYHPSIITQVKKRIHFAVGNLCLAAWAAREETWSQRPFSMPLHTLVFVHQLRKDREEKQARRAPTLHYEDNHSVLRNNVSESQADLSIVSAANHLTINEAQPEVTLPFGTFEMQGRQPVYEQQLQQSELPPQLQFQQQNLHQPQVFWWEDPTRENALSDREFEFNSIWQDLGSGASAMDWTQWDLLLKDDRPP